MVPKGKLILIGGAEDKGTGFPDSSQYNREFESYEILKELLPDKDEHAYRIEIITTAPRDAPSSEKDYRKAFAELGIDDLGFIHVRSNEDTNNKRNVTRIEKANTIFLTGGDQFTVATLLGCSAMAEAMGEKYRHDTSTILAGTSAGAMVIPKIMIFEGQRHEAILKGSAKLMSGLGYIDHFIVDTHFIKRGRFVRLAEAVVMNLTCVGIGLGEDTALVIREGNKATCKGSGMVVIVDGSDIGHTNIALAEMGSPVSIENLRVHILCKDYTYLLKEREFVPSREALRKEKTG